MHSRLKAHLLAVESITLVLILIVALIINVELEG